MASVVRRYEPGDLSAILQLWDRAGCVPLGPDGLTLDQAVELVTTNPTLTLVVEADGQVVGIGVGGLAAAVGWVYRLTVAADDADTGGLTQELLAKLEVELAKGGARKVAAVIREDAESQRQLRRRGYSPSPGMLYLERDLPPTGVAVPAAIAELGAQMVRPGLWEELKGLEEAKEIIERRVILPLAEPSLAARHGVAPPKAIVLFGPPGTGKTTFAKGIASRLGWPFVEIEPSEISREGPERQAKLLAESFGRVRTDLASAVVFVDEVEDLASIRGEERKVSPSVTNEFLKQIPRMRELSEHLLVCATNWVSRLDHAFLRPGRFDYVLPVGAPDAEARSAIWRRYVEEITDEPVHIDELVQKTELFTPADIEFAARQAAQHAFRARALRGRKPPRHPERLPHRHPAHPAVAVDRDRRRLRRRRQTVRTLLVAWSGRESHQRDDASDSHRQGNYAP